MPKETKKVNLTENLNRLTKLSQWFDEQEELDVEEGLEKVKEAALLIKESKGRLKEIENEFEAVKQDIEEEIEMEDNEPEHGEEKIDDLDF